MRRLLLFPFVVLLVSLACSGLEINLDTRDVPAVTQTPMLDPNDPHVELTVEPASPKVGELVIVTADAVEIGMPYFYLWVQDEGAVESAELGKVTNSTGAAGQEGASQVVQFVQAEADGNQATFTLLALAPGTTTVWATASGEVQSDDGAWMWGGGASYTVTLTVTDQ